MIVEVSGLGFFDIGIVDEGFVGFVEKQGDLAVQAAREVGGDLDELFSAGVREDGRGGVIDGDDVDEADLVTVGAELVDFFAEFLGVDALVVFGDGDDAKAHSLEEMAIDVIHGVGGEDDAGRDQLGDGLKQAGGAAGSDDELEAIKDVRGQVTDLVFEVEIFNGLNEVG